MTPKEKAKELLEKYLAMENNTNGFFHKRIAKQCTLICVDAIINALDSENIIYGSEYRYEETVFWEIVKQETIKL